MGTDKQYDAQNQSEQTHTLVELQQDQNNQTYIHYVPIQGNIYLSVVQFMLELCQKIGLRHRNRYVAKIYLDNFLRQESNFYANTANQLIIACVKSVIKIHQKFTYQDLLDKLYEYENQDLNMNIVAVYQLKIINYQKALKWDQVLNPFDVLTFKIRLNSIMNPLIQNLIDKLILMIMLTQKSRQIDANLIIYAKYGHKLFEKKQQKGSVYSYIRAKQILSNPQKKTILQELITTILKQLKYKGQYNPQLLHP